MLNLRNTLFALAAVLLSACGGSDNTIVGLGGTTGPVADVSSLTLITSSPSIPSDGSRNATITALVRDENNNVVPGVGVVFSSSSGSLLASATQTDDNGVVTADLGIGGDASLRDITITGIANGDIQAAVTVSVIGTSIDIAGPNSLPLGEDGNYTVTLTDDGGNGIPNTLVDIASANGNGISVTPVTTDTQGAASFVLTATNSGTDTLTASALGAGFSKTVVVSSDAFSFNAPATPPNPPTEIDLGANQLVEVLWQQSGAGVANRPVSFFTTRGTLSAASATTDANGVASVTVSANTAGPALITATNDDGTSIQVNVEFVATTPATLELQANPFTVPTNDQSTITAIVRDANGNLVKNQIVSFVLTDNTNGYLSVAQATTNSQGRAQTAYNASSTTSAVDGVRIDATVQGFPAVTDFVKLTVAQREVFISIGTGNEVFEPNSAQYRKEWVVQVTDAQGNGVDLVNVSLSILSERYWDGIRAFFDPPGVWLTRPGFEAFPVNGCTDEDVNRNGTLDVPGEDFNANGRVEAGNIATAVAQDGGGSTVTTDVNGFAIVDVYYPQEYAYWLEVTLEARTAVQGTEFAESTTFVLPGSFPDFSQADSAPPGVRSPFGTDGDCATPPPPNGP